MRNATRRIPKARFADLEDGTHLPTKGATLLRSKGVLTSHQLFRKRESTG